MGGKSTLAEILAARDAGGVDQERELALFDVEGSSVLRSAADRLPGFQIRRAGRPKGRRNRSTAQLLAMVERRAGTDPLLWMADWLRLTPREVSKVLNCTDLEAAEYQRKLASEVNAFCRGRPVQVQLTGADGEGLPIFAPIFVQGAEQAREVAGWGLPQGTVLDGIFQQLEGGVTEGDVTDAPEGEAAP